MPSVILIGDVARLIDMYYFAQTEPPEPVPGSVYYNATEQQLRVYDGNTSEWVAFDTSTSGLSDCMVLVQEGDDYYATPEKGYMYIGSDNSLSIYTGSEWTKIGTTKIDVITLSSNINGTVYTQLEQSTDFGDSSPTNTYYREFRIPITNDVVPFFFLETTDENGTRYSNVEVEHVFETYNGIDVLTLKFDDRNIPSTLRVKLLDGTTKVEKYAIYDGVTFESANVDSSFSNLGSIDLIEIYQITLQNTLDVDAENYPVLITLDATNFNFLASDGTGNDLKFSTDAEGTSLCSVEKVTWDYIDRTASFYVQVPTLAPGENTIYLTVGAGGTTYNPLTVALFNNYELTANGTPTEANVILPYENTFVIEGAVTGSATYPYVNIKLSDAGGNVNLTVPLPVDAGEQTFTLECDENGSVTINETLVGVLTAESIKTLTLTNLQDEVGLNTYYFTVMARKYVDDGPYTQAIFLTQCKETMSIVPGMYCFRNVIDTGPTWDADQMFVKLYASADPDENWVLLNKTLGANVTLDEVSFFEITEEKTYVFEYSAPKHYSVIKTALWAVGAEFYATMVG